MSDALRQLDDSLRTVSTSFGLPSRKEKPQTPEQWLTAQPWVFIPQNPPVSSYTDNVPLVVEPCTGQPFALATGRPMVEALWGKAWSPPNREKHASPAPTRMLVLVGIGVVLWRGSRWLSDPTIPDKTAVYETILGFQTMDDLLRIATEFRMRIDYSALAGYALALNNACIAAGQQFTALKELEANLVASGPPDAKP
jgi:hypothetical protein